MQLVERAQILFYNGKALRKCGTKIVWITRVYSITKYLAHNIRITSAIQFLAEYACDTSQVSTMVIGHVLSPSQLVIETEALSIAIMLHQRVLSSNFSTVFVDIFHATTYLKLTNRK